MPRRYRDDDKRPAEVGANMRVEVLLPQWGMGMNEGTILEWLKDVGEEVVEDEPLAEVESAKAQQTLEAPATGRLVEILVAEGDTAEVRSPVAVIETS
jgi:2-oxoglutarate dehydrogenase E2 component (dihydrolipoamide succinyltransferase)